MNEYDATVGRCDHCGAEQHPLRLRWINTLHRRGIVDPAHIIPAFVCPDCQQQPGVSSSPHQSA
jgi:hypothetical protein